MTSTHLPTAVLFVATAFLIAGCGAQVFKPLSELCLGCICAAVSNSSACDFSIGCTSNVCGAFKITKEYWMDAKKPVIEGGDQNDSQAYEKCVTDIECAGHTVRNYMQKHAEDCNHDGVVDCYDYSAIHLYGAYGCQRQLTNSPAHPRYIEILEACKNKVLQYVNDAEGIF